VDNGSSVNYVWAFADWTDSRVPSMQGGRLLRGIILISISIVMIVMFAWWILKKNPFQN
jgi:hypothetical protein